MLVQMRGKYGDDYVNIDPDTIEQIVADNKDNSSLELRDGKKWILPAAEVERIA